MNLSELVNRLVKETMRRMRVSMPAEVIKYDAGRSMVQVKIVQPEIMPDGEIVDQSIISEVPVSFMQCGGAVLSFPINPGDTGLVVFADRDIGGWVSAGDTGAPETNRTHSITDGVFIPGIQPGGASVNADDVEISYAGSLINIRKDGLIELTGNLKVNGFIEASGEVTAISDGASVTLSQHQHTGNLGAPTSPPTPGT